MFKKVLLSLSLLLALTGCTVHTNNYNYSNSGSYTEFKDTVIFDNPNQFTSINIDWIDGIININEAGGDQLLLSENSRSGNLPLYYLTSNGTLDIKYCKSGTSYQEIDKAYKVLELLIPSSITKIKIDMVSTNVNMTGKDFNKIDIDSVSGEINLNIRSVEDVDVDGISADFTLSLGDSTSLNKIDMDTVSGNHTLYLDGKKGYNLNFDTVSGKLTKEFIDGSDSSLGKFNIDFDSVSGDLLIAKLPE